MAITPANEEIREEIISVFPNVVFVSSFKDIKTLSLKSNNILLSQPSLFEVFDSFCSTYTVYRHTEHLQQSDNTIMTCINNAINRISIPDKAHFIEA